LVRFGDYPLRHVLGVQVQESRVIHDRFIPSATVGYRADETVGGRILLVTGEIRDVDYMLRIEDLRRRADDVARNLDLEDDSATINAKLGSVEASWNVADGLEYVAYRATFHETS